MNNTAKSYILTIVVISFWATSAAAFKIALSHVTPYVLLFYSSLISTCIFAAVLVFQKKVRLLKMYNTKDLLHAALLGLLNPFGYYVVLFKAYDLLPGQIAMSLNYGWPIALSILSMPILKHTVSFKQIISIMISFAGVVIIATRGEVISFTGLSFLGVILALSSTLIWATFWLINTKNQHDPVVKLFWGFCFGVLYTLIFSPFIDSLYLPPAQAFFAISYISFFEMGITFILWLTALKLASNTAKISNMIFITPFLSLLVLNTVLDEQLFLSTFAGLILIITGIISQGIKKRAQN
jgi:drug/metabolite transporter (DMT)-like permease